MNTRGTFTAVSTHAVSIDSCRSQGGTGWKRPPFLSVQACWQRQAGADSARSPREQQQCAFESHDGV